MDGSGCNSTTESDNEFVANTKIDSFASFSFDIEDSGIDTISPGGYINIWSN